MQVNANWKKWSLKELEWEKSTTAWLLTSEGTCSKVKFISGTKFQIN